jgi:hypothetical protein
MFYQIQTYTLLQYHASQYNQSMLFLNIVYDSYRPLWTNYLIALFFLFLFLSLENLRRHIYIVLSLFYSSDFINFNHTSQVELFFFKCSQVKLIFQSFIISLKFRVKAPLEPKLLIMRGALWVGPVGDVHTI